MAGGFIEEDYVPEWKVELEREERLTKLAFYVLGGVVVAAGLSALFVPEVLHEYVPITKEIPDNTLRKIGFGLTSFGFGLILGNRIRW